MSEQEFELYLKLLSRCLSLTSGQREQIADELRDHLEERLHELARAGVAREKAVVQALDEFGDAAVLAAHFTTIARLKRRRFLMRLSLGSVGVLTATLLIAFAFWPDNRAVRGPERIVAQEKRKAENQKHEKTRPAKPRDNARSAPPIPSGFVTASGATEHPLSSDFQHSKSEERIEEALNQPVDFTIEPQPLRHAIDFISARYQIPILIDQRAIENANVDLTTEVAASFPGIKLRNLLKLLLEPLSAPLTYVIEDEVLKITTVDKSNELLTVVVYDCRDLARVATLDHFPAETLIPKAGTAGVFQLSPEALKSAHAAGPTAGAKAAPPAAKHTTAPAGIQSSPSDGRLPLIQTLMAASAPDSWGDGPTISEFGGLLVVLQTRSVHERIKNVLADIRLIKKDGAFASLANQFDVEARRRLVEATTPRGWVPSVTTDQQRPIEPAKGPFDPAKAP